MSLTELLGLIAAIMAILGIGGIIQINQKIFDKETQDKFYNKHVSPIFEQVIYIILMILLFFILLKKTPHDVELAKLILLSLILLVCAIVLFFNRKRRKKDAYFYYSSIKKISPLDSSNDKYYIVSKDNKYGLINYFTCFAIIPCIYDDLIFDRIDEHIIIANNNKEGIYNKTAGEIILPTKYESIISYNKKKKIFTVLINGQKVNIEKRQIDLH